VHGFLGPNGAGKTTTIRILLGLLRRDAGRAALLGGDPWRDAVALHRRLAYVPGEVYLWPNFTGGEVIDLLGALRGGLDPIRRADLLDRFELDPTKRCRAYSKGNRQKVALVAAFASDVELYLLDEPTSGLDPLMETVFQDVVRETRRAGRTVLLSSHILSEVEALCDRVTIVRAGRAAESGTFDELRHLTQTSVVVETGRALDGIGALPGVHDARADGRQVRFSADQSELNAVLARLVACDVRSLVTTPPTLEELFLRHYGCPGGCWACPRSPRRPRPCGRMTSATPPGWSRRPASPPPARESGCWGLSPAPPSVPTRWCVTTFWSRCWPR